jgi:hypothetical protein
MAREWSVKIVGVKNGWEVTTSDEDGRREFVFQDKSESEDGERAGFTECIRSVAEYFGQLGSKHDKKRIVIGYSEKWTEIQNLLFP